MASIIDLYPRQSPPAPALFALLDEVMIDVFRSAIISQTIGGLLEGRENPELYRNGGSFPLHIVSSCCYKGVP